MNGFHFYQKNKLTIQTLLFSFYFHLATSKNENKIVTAYYEFESKHSAEEYKKWMINLFQTSDPMIIFLEPDSKWFDIIKELRSHAPTLVVPLKFDDLVMSRTFTKEFWDYEHSIDTEAAIHKGSSVYKIWNEKLVSFIKLC